MLNSKANEIALIFHLNFCIKIWGGFVMKEENKKRKSHSSHSDEECELEFFLKRAKIEMRKEEEQRKITEMLKRL